ncbi:hypothetical protein CCACVL1_18357 [Corchorus capsularis]|uniref:Uncharacterized protein n=1 Tax=Corchorus capsularis TaxID=210143 RepID=A0A1R3HLR5_COCAP|nr:hypothetical protein CCACVL1_18357 [Corchorus capsularis]
MTKRSMCKNCNITELLFYSPSTLFSCRLRDLGSSWILLLNTLVLMTPIATVWRTSITAKRPKGGVFRESLHNHGLGGNHLHHTSITH